MRKEYQERKTQSMDRIVQNFFEKYTYRISPPFSRESIFVVFDVDRRYYVLPAVANSSPSATQAGETDINPFIYYQAQEI